MLEISEISYLLVICRITGLSDFISEHGNLSEIVPDEIMIHRKIGLFTIDLVNRFEVFLLATSPYSCNQSQLHHIVVTNLFAV